MNQMYNQGGYNQGYGGQQGYGNMQGGGVDLNHFKKNQGGGPAPVKLTVGTEEIREMVQRLNSKPFNENFTLVSFDELSNLELLELINKILVHLDPKNNVNIKDETQNQTAVRFSNYLQVLGYPSNFDIGFQQGMVQGDKKILYPILFFLVTRFPELQKRAYLAKFLVPIQVPEEFLGDEEMKRNYQQYKELQAEFQAQHQQLESLQKEAMSPNDIKKEINQLEQEKDQLMAKINLFKNKNTNKPEFQALLEATNLLRREQEEEAKLSDKVRTQTQQYEWTEQQLYASQQRLVEAKKSLSIDNTPEQMLMGVRAEVKKNRDLCNERLANEINEKKNKLDQIQQLLSEPPVPQSELNKLENTVVMLRRAVQNLEEKLAREVNPDEDKLSMYKKQANLVAKKKEQAIEEIKKLEEERTALERDIQRKEQEIQKVKGPNYKSADDFKQYAAGLRDKTTKCKKLREELKEIKAEASILQRTEQIVRSKKAEYEAQLKQVEQRLGVLGYTDTKQKLEEISEQKERIDEQKGKTLEEISQIVQTIKNTIQTKRSKLAPVAEDLKKLRDRFNETNAIYTQKKAEYDQTFAGVESENAALLEEVKKVKDECYREDTKVTTMKYQMQVIDLQIARLDEEEEYLSGKKQLSKEHKSYRDYLQAQIKEQDVQIKDLKKKRDTVKENYEPSLRQTAMLKDLKQLLELKMAVAKNEFNNSKSGGGRRVEESRGNVNRLVVRE